jgi:uncharacterized protein (TIGR02246 family)
VEAASLEDRLGIMDLVARYCWALNTGDANGFLDCFIDDGVFEHLPNPPLRGHAEIGRMLEYLWYDRPGWYIGRQQHATNFLIRTDGDRAEVKAYWQMVQWEQDPRGRLFTGSIGHWDGRAARRDGAWRWERLLVVPWENDQLPWVGDERAKYRFSPPGSEGADA